uniref:Uncharacterized protein n=1 Tax=Tetradesmus obliquus TaxID=3088 RepID=A0A383VM61_TETOB|eukprot:jgi/Sobl393_1/12381/SZX66627.1
MAHRPTVTALASRTSSSTSFLKQRALQCGCHAVHQQVPTPLQQPARQLQLHTSSRQRRYLVQAQNEDRAQQKVTRPKAPATAPTKDPQQQPTSPPQQQQQEQWHNALAWLQEKWQQLDLPQKAYTVVAGLVLLVALPKVLVLLVLLLERVLIGGLLALEEVLLQLLLKGGALLGVLGAVALVGAGVYVFARKAIK